MSVKIRPYRNGGWEVDIAITLPDGTKRRERRKAPVSTRDGAFRWARARERELYTHKPAEKQRKAPMLAAFAPRFLDCYAVANRQKPSGIAAKETIIRVHLVPLLGRKRLDDITNEDVQRLKTRLRNRATKTVNNCLSVLSMLLKVAVEWGVIEHMPCTIRLLPMTRPNEAEFHDFDQYERLIEAAREVDARAYIVVLLGGDAGLRCGEMMALKWTDIDLVKRMLWVQHSEWKGHVTVPKGGRARLIPLTVRLTRALRAHRHLQSERVLCQDDGRPLTQKIVRTLVHRSARLAGLANGKTHSLRHTFCSHLAMRGAPARAIQELAGHAGIQVTQRYMHLSPAAIEGAIRLLDEPVPSQVRGEILETDDGPRGT
jgi:integrase